MRAFPLSSVIFLFLQPMEEPQIERSPRRRLLSARLRRSFRLIPRYSNYKLTVSGTRRWIRNIHNIRVEKTYAVKCKAKLPSLFETFSLRFSLSDLTTHRNFLRSYIGQTKPDGAELDLVAAMRDNFHVRLSNLIRRYNNHVQRYA